MTPELAAELAAAMKAGFNRWEPCPMFYCTGETNGVLISGQVHGVWLRPGESVRWLWTDDAVVGYDIIHVSHAPDSVISMDTPPEEVE